MPIRLSRQLVAAAGSAATAASLIGFAALSQTLPPQTRPVALTAGDAEIFVPDTSTFDPSVAEGFPPIERVLQGGEVWNPTSQPADSFIFLEGTDTQTTIGSFVNDDFLETSGSVEGVPTTLPVPAAGSEIDLANFGGGFENEWANLVYGDLHTTTDTIITPFGNYTLPLGSTAAQAGAAVPAEVVGYSFTDFLNSLQNTVSAGEAYLTDAGTAFSEGAYLTGVSDALAGFGNLTVGEQADLLVNGYSFLVDSDGNAGFALSALKAPADLADAFAQAQQFASDAQGLITTALSDFTAGDEYFGLVNIANAGIESTYASDEIILGLTETLLQSTVP
ncbi:hypothetical protein [Mycobacterium paraterrae]|uniref:PE-PGRS family protein n=1 Tax=Mycobacterium paraterrae TaxID=577492 RepID=A0ABY3VKC7_9MYCO|nr:hypothetical protein [Mycobacterium paraterrae]UMB69871.1 hypothetical protein MKK62_00405 [Mycobacterium paraterrae]